MDAKCSLNKKNKICFCLDRDAGNENQYSMVRAHHTPHLPKTDYCFSFYPKWEGKCCSCKTFWMDTKKNLLWYIVRHTAISDHYMNITTKAFVKWVFKDFFQCVWNFVYFFAIFLTLFYTFENIKENGFSFIQNFGLNGPQRTFW